MTQPTKEQMADMVDSVKIKALDILNNPKVRGISKIGAGLLTISNSLVGNKSLFTISSAVISTVNLFGESFELPESSPASAYLKSRRYKCMQGIIPVILYYCGVRDDLPTKAVFAEHHLNYVRIDFGNGNILLFKEYNESTPMQSSDPSDKIQRDYYISENFDFDVLFNYIWSKNPHGISLVSAPADTQYSSSRTLLKSMAKQGGLYIGDLSVDFFAKEIASVKSLGVSRSYLMVGKPGCGKTSFVELVATKFRSRILKVDPQVLDNLRIKELEFIVSHLNPEILLFDDFDRIRPSDEGKFLFLLENLKQDFPQLTIFATANDISALSKAMIRPGRIDEVIWVDTPSVETLERILRGYLQELSVPLVEDRISVAAQLAAGMTPAYIKELALRICRRGYDCIEPSVAEFARAESCAGEQSPPADQTDDLGIL